MKTPRLLLAAGLFLAGVLSATAAEKLTVGFSQIGAESAWRTANTDSIKSEAEKRGIKLQFADAQQKQENQIKALRSFIAQGVDVIAFSPVVETGWELDSKLSLFKTGRRCQCRNAGTFPIKSERAPRRAPSGCSSIRHAPGRRA